MLAAIYTQALFIVADVAYLRGAGVVLAFVRTFLDRKRFVAFRMGWVEALCAVEPLLLLAVTYHVQSGAVPAGSATFGRMVLALAGAALALGGAGLLVWSFLSWPGIFAGHGVLADHKLMTGAGPTGLSATPSTWRRCSSGSVSRSAISAGRPSSSPPST